MRVLHILCTVLVLHNVRAYPTPEAEESCIKMSKEKEAEIDTIIEKLTIYLDTIALEHEDIDITLVKINIEKHSDDEKADKETMVELSVNDCAIIGKNTTYSNPVNKSNKQLKNKPRENNNNSRKGDFGSDENVETSTKLSKAISSTTSTSATNVSSRTYSEVSHDNNKNRTTTFQKDERNNGNKAHTIDDEKETQNHTQTITTSSTKDINIRNKKDIDSTKSTISKEHIDKNNDHSAKKNNFAKNNLNKTTIGNSVTNENNLKVESQSTNSLNPESNFRPIQFTDTNEPKKEIHPDKQQSHPKENKKIESERSTTTSTSATITDATTTKNSVKHSSIKSTSTNTSKEKSDENNNPKTGKLPQVPEEEVKKEVFVKYAEVLLVPVEMNESTSKEQPEILKAVNINRTVDPSYVFVSDKANKRLILTDLSNKDNEPNEKADVKTEYYIPINGGTDDVSRSVKKDFEVDLSKNANVVIVLDGENRVEVLQEIEEQQTEKPFVVLLNEEEDQKLVFLN